MTVHKKSALTFACLGVLVTVYSLAMCFQVGAQNITAFTVHDQFLLPASNGVIKFSLNGTCQAATINNGSWSFANLRLNNSGSPTNVSIFLKDSNITVRSCRTFNSTLGVEAQVAYNVTGDGSQTFSFSSNLKGGSWLVVFNRNTNFVQENHGWVSAPNGTITINGAASGFNVTATYYLYPQSLGGNGNVSNQPFIAQHSMIVATGIAVAVAVILAVAVRGVNLRRQRKTTAPGTAVAVWQSDKSVDRKLGKR